MWVIKRKRAWHKDIVVLCLNCEVAGINHFTRNRFCGFEENDAEIRGRHVNSSPTRSVSEKQVHGPSLRAV